MKRLLITLAAVATVTGASAQSWGGLLLDKDIMMPADLMELSQTQFNFATARAASMAGAFTSLGADLSSMSINPAGLGMYRRGEFSITPLLTIANASTVDATAYGRNSRTSFGLANFGAVFNVYESPSRGLMSLNIGFGYNRISDLNYNYSFQRQGQNASVADALARQLSWGGMSKNNFYNDKGAGAWSWDRIAPEYWLNALAYRSFMIDQENPDDPKTWKPTWIGNDADVGHYTTVESRGSIGEFNLSIGANIGNKFYIGGSLGIQTVYQKKHIDYDEDYVYSTRSEVNPEFGMADLNYQLLYAKLNQAVVLDGMGVNFKLGFVYRPTEALRIGVAIHTPTYYSLSRKYQGSAAGMAYANNDVDPNVKPDKNGYISTDGDSNMTTPELRDNGDYSWSFCAPTRLMFGVSYAFGERAVISVDYERDWYNGIRIKDNPSSMASADYNDTFRRNYKASNTLRVGAEIKPAPRLAVRAGFGYNGSMLKDEQMVYSAPTIKQTTYYSAGLGFAFTRSFYLDLAYQYMQSKSANYDLFFAEDDAGMVESSLYRTDLLRHNVMMTLGFRF